MSRRIHLAARGSYPDCHWYPSDKLHTVPDANAFMALPKDRRCKLCEAKVDEVLLERGNAGMWRLGLR